MSVDKPVRPASEVALEILELVSEDELTFHDRGEANRVRMLVERDRQEARAAALEEAADVAKKQKEFYDGLRDQCTRKSDEYNLYDEDAGVCHIIERDIRALATRSTEEPAPEEKD